MLLRHHSANTIVANSLLWNDFANTIGHGFHPFLGHILVIRVRPTLLDGNLLANLIGNSLDSLFRHHLADFVLMRPDFRLQSRYRILYRLETLLRNIFDAVNNLLPYFRNPNVFVARYRRRLYFDQFVLLRCYIGTRVNRLARVHNRNPLIDKGTRHLVSLSFPTSRRNLYGLLIMHRFVDSISDLPGTDFLDRTLNNILSFPEFPLRSGNNVWNLF